MSNLTQQIQEDWTNRNEIEKVSLSILQIAEFLNKFEQNTRIKLGELNQKLTYVERKLEYVETALESYAQARAMRS